MIILRPPPQEDGDEGAVLFLALEVGIIWGVVVYIHLKG